MGLDSSCDRSPKNRLKSRHLLFLCFGGLTQASDRVRLNDVVAILQEKHMPSDTTRTTYSRYELRSTIAQTRIRANREHTEDIKISAGIRQGDSLCPGLAFSPGNEQNHRKSKALTRIHHGQ